MLLTDKQHEHMVCGGTCDGKTSLTCVPDPLVSTCWIADGCKSAGAIGQTHAHGVGQ